MANLGAIGRDGVTGNQYRLKASQEPHKGGVGNGVALGGVGRDGVLNNEYRLRAALSPGWNFVLYRPRFIGIGGGISDRLWFGQKNTTDGSPSQPCLEFTDANALFRFRWIVQAGTRTLSISVANISGLTPYPTMTIRANAAIGVNSDAVGTAGSGTGWQTIGPLSVSPSSDGVLLVELYSGGINANNIRTVRWDNVRDSTGRSDQFANWFNGAPVIDINEAISPAIAKVYGSVG